jgi:glycosylphosphatidylinositol transamidase (GPIT) subunit GPI8
MKFEIIYQDSSEHSSIKLNNYKAYLVIGNETYRINKTSSIAKIKNIILESLEAESIISKKEKKNG